MGAKILSISITEQEKQWLDDNNVSPTQIFKQKVFEMMQINLPLRKELKIKEETIERLIKRIESCYLIMNDDQKKQIEEKA